MNLLELINLTAKYIDEDATNATVKEIIKDGINIAYRKIAREKLVFLSVEAVPSGGSPMRTFLKLKEANVDGLPVHAKIIGDLLFFDTDGLVEIIYYYLPDELVNDTDDHILPTNIEERLLCYYAAFHYMNIDGSDEGSKWLSLWEDGFNNINRIRSVNTKIKDVYGISSAERGGTSLPEGIYGGVVYD